MDAITLIPLNSYLKINNINSPAVRFFSFLSTKKADKTILSAFNYFEALYYT